MLFMKKKEGFLPWEEYKARIDSLSNFYAFQARLSEQLR